MFQNKLFNFALIIIVSIAMLGVVAIVGFQYLSKPSDSNKAPKAATAQELADSQFVVDKITTNLSGSSLVQLGVSLQTDSSKAVSELELRKAQVRDTITQILHSTTRVDLDKAEGIQRLKQQIKENVNQYLQKGKVIDVYITDIAVQ